MSVIEAIEHEHSESVHIQRPMHRFLVLKECEAPFKIELEMLDAFRALVHRLSERAFIFRLPHAWAIYSAQVRIYRRNQGLATARRRAVGCTVLIVTPEWLSSRIAELWRKGRRKSA